MTFFSQIPHGLGGGMGSGPIVPQPTHNATANTPGSILQQNARDGRRHDAGGPRWAACLKPISCRWSTPFTITCSSFWPATRDNIMRSLGNSACRHMVAVAAAALLQVNSRERDRPRLGESTDAQDCARCRPRAQPQGARLLAEDEPAEGIVRYGAAGHWLAAWSGLATDAAWRDGHVDHAQDIGRAGLADAAEALALTST
jgi:hypothetical protein